MNKYFTDLVDLVGSRPQPFANTKKYISTGALKTDYISEEDIEIVDYISRPSRADLEVKTGDMLFAKMAYTDKRLLVSEKDANHIYSTGFFAIRPKKGIITSKCLYFLLKSVPFKNQKDSNSTGATQKAITIDGLKKIQLRIPEFNKQEDIGLILDNLERIIKYKQQQLLDYDQLIKSRFVELFLNKNYEYKSLKDLLKSKAEYGAASASVPYENGRPRYVRITDINDDGTLNNDTVCSINTQDDIDYKLEYGDFLFARMGATVGKTYAFIEGNEIFAGYLIRFKLDLNKINPRYLFAYTKTNEYNMWVKNNQSGAAQPGINAKKYDLLHVPVPPIELQNEFASFVEQVDKLKFAIQASLEEKRKLFDSLMQKYFG